MEDGLGDTIRVSLTEDPEFEIPVAKKLIEKGNKTKNNLIVTTNKNISYNPYQFN